MQPNIVSQEEWLQARTEHLKREKEFTRARDRLLEERRSLPWVRVEQDYVFETEQGRKRLADLFDGRSQLFVQHVMFGPGASPCPGCSLQADHVDAARQHFEHADLSFVAVSRAPLEEILAIKRRMGWGFNWVSSAGSSFNYDYGVSFTPEQIASGTASYNFGTVSSPIEDLHGSSVFNKDEAGEVYHSYSAYARGGEPLVGAFSWLDMAPKGRNEGTGVMSWVRLHDEYDNQPTAHECCGGREAAE